MKSEEWDGFFTDVLTDDSIPNQAIINVEIVKEHTPCRNVSYTITYHML